MPEGKAQMVYVKRDFQVKPAPEVIKEAFEHHKIEHKIKTPTGDFPYLNDLITYTLNETSWNLSRNTKQALPKLKI